MIAAQKKGMPAAPAGGLENLIVASIFREVTAFYPFKKLTSSIPKTLCVILSATAYFIFYARKYQKIDLELVI